jgi:hypothetical protein
MIPKTKFSIMKKVLLFGVLFFLTNQLYSQQDKYWYRFPKGSFKVSLVVPEVSLETASKNCSTFDLCEGSHFERDSSDAIQPLFYVYAQYRYYFKTPRFKRLNDGPRAEGFYVHGGGYTYQSQVDATAGSLVLGVGPGFQMFYGKYFFTDIFITPGLAMLSDGQSIGARPTITAGLKIGIDITAFDDDK